MIFVNFIICQIYNFQYAIVISFKFLIIKSGIKNSFSKLNFPKKFN